MKLRVTIENDRTGQSHLLTIEAGPGESLFEKIDAVVHGYGWNMLDVELLDEPDVPIPYDPRFPGRPTHPDFARLSSAVAEQDAVADVVGLEAALSADVGSLHYMGRHRVEALLRGEDITWGMLTKLMAIYFDAFQLGVGFTERGGHRPHKTGNTGEKEGSR